MTAIGELIAGIRATLIADGDLAAMISANAVYDRTPPNPRTPYVTFDLTTSGTEDGDGAPGELHLLGLTAWSGKAGRLEAIRIAGRARELLHDAAIVLPNHRIVFLRVDAIETDLAPEIRGARATLTLRALTEPNN